MIKFELIGILIAAGILFLPFLFLARKTQLKSVSKRFTLKRNISKESFILLVLLIILNVNRVVMSNLNLSFSYYELSVVLLILVISLKFLRRVTKE